MGAIIKLKTMPSKCSECPFSDKEARYCRLRDSMIIAGARRSVRMPLCPLRNEGAYLSDVLKKIKIRNILAGNGELFAERVKKAHDDLLR